MLANYKGDRRGAQTKKKKVIHIYRILHYLLQPYCPSYDINSQDYTKMQPRRSTRLNSEKRRKTTNIRDLDPFGDDKDYKAQMSLRRKRTSFRYMILCFVVLTIVLISSFAFYRQSWYVVTLPFKEILRITY